jgi:hypothetical protein
MDWGDTAAIVHMTPFDYGMIPETKGRTSETLTVRNGQRENMAKYGTLIGTVCNTHGSMIVCASSMVITRSFMFFSQSPVCLHLSSGVNTW